MDVYILERTVQIRRTDAFMLGQLLLELCVRNVCVFDVGQLFGTVKKLLYCMLT